MFGVGVLGFCPGVLGLRMLNETDIALYRFDITVKKEGWGGGGTRTIKFSSTGAGETAQLKPTNKILSIAIGQGLPKDSRPGLKKTATATGRGGYGGGGTPDILRDAAMVNRPAHGRAAPTRPAVHQQPSTKMHRPPSQDAPSLPSSPTRRAPSRPGAPGVDRMHSREFLQTPNPGRAG